MAALSAQFGLLYLTTFVRSLGVVALLPGVGALGHFRSRLALAFVLTLLLGTTATGQSPTPSQLPIVLFQELMLGIGFGFGIRVLFTAAQVLGELLLHSSGLAQVAWQQAMGSQTATGVPRFLELTLIAVFFSTGGHRALISNLLRSLVDTPVGSFDVARDGVGLALGFLARSFELGVYTAFPLLASAGIAMVVTGLINRLIPELASVMASAGIGYVILLLTLMLGIGAITGMFDSGINSYADLFGTHTIR